jgi:hypothetical protein
MKAIRMRMQKFSRPGVILLAFVVVIITSMVAANATQTITTPNAAFISYSLAAGASSAAITPATNRSVLVMGCCTTAGAVATGHVSLIVSPGFAIEWVGLQRDATITAGSATAGGTHIVTISLQSNVDIQSASATTILIHNGSLGTRAGNVTLVW